MTGIVSAIRFAAIPSAPSVVAPLPAPSISWRFETETASWTQQAYEIEVVEPNGTTHTTGRVINADSIHVDWPFHPLGPRERRSIRVRVWGAEDTPSPWSEPVAVNGSLTAKDWTADLIAPAGCRTDPHAPGPGYLLRTGFSVPDSVVSATLHITAHGVFTAEINGVAVSDDVLAPGWTSYRHRLRYQSHDVAHLLSQGANVVGVQLADGWFRGRLGFEGGKTDIYGDHVGVIAQLEITCADGATHVVRTDQTWKSSKGPIVTTGLYEGEHVDARNEQSGWSAPGFDDSAWSGVDTIAFDTDILEAPLGPPVRRIDTLTSVSEVRRERRVLLDFGQNASGRLRVTATGTAGSGFRIRHAEVLEIGELCTRPLRGAAATDSYVFGADRSITWEPRFTIHGFRYAEVELDDGVELESAVFVVCHSDMARTGWFSCSEPLLERLHENVVWSMKSNFVDVPTDCPQRDERLGWTGDIGVFAPTATFLYDCEGFLSSWLRDLDAEQRDTGSVPFYVPWIDLLFPPVPAAAWGDAAVDVPEALYRRYGGLTVLRTQYASMRAWVEQVAQLSGDRGLWDMGFQFGDWLDPAAPPDRPAAARTDPSIVATGYLVRSAGRLADMARLLGEAADAERFSALAAHVRAAFRREYVTTSGRLASDAQTAYALAIVFDLLEPHEVAVAGKRLVKLVADEEFRIGTGFVGTPLVCDALERAGHIDVAYQLLNQTKCPSWLYPITLGATTIWERWDSMLADGRVNPGDMTSFNHYALGAVADWLHRSVAGLAYAAPGGRRLTFAPKPGGALTFAEAKHNSPYGRAGIRWERSGGALRVEIEVPPNCVADVTLPGNAPIEVGSGRHSFTGSFRDASDDPVMIVKNPFVVALEAAHEARAAIEAAREAQRA